MLACWALVAALATQALADPREWPFRRTEGRDEPGPEPPKAITITASDGQVLVSESSVIIVD